MGNQLVSTEPIDLHLDYNDVRARNVRSVLFQLLYAYDASQYDCSLFEIVDMFNRGFGMTIPMGSKAIELVQEVAEHRDELDAFIKPLLMRWRFDRIGTCTKLILRISLWELQHSSLDVALILNEAIELAKCFAEPDSYKFINGVLDRYVKLHLGDITKRSDPDLEADKEDETESDDAAATAVPTSKLTRAKCRQQPPGGTQTCSL